MTVLSFSTPISRDFHDQKLRKSITYWHWIGDSCRLWLRLCDSVPRGIVPTSRITATSSIRHPTAHSRTASPAQLLWPTGFLCGCYVGLEFPAGQLAESDYWREQFQTISEDVSVRNVLMHSAHRGFTTMRYINRLFTYCQGQSVTVSDRKLAACWQSLSVVHGCRRFNAQRIIGFTQEKKRNL